MGSTFVKHTGNPVLVRGPLGAWDHGDVANPDVFWDPVGTRWVMNYSGWDDIGTWRMGLAYSTNLLTWTKEPTNPVFEPDPAIEGTYIAANGSIAYKAPYYWHFYHGDNGDTRAARSTDLLDWERVNGGAVVIAKGAPGQWDSGKCTDPSVRLADDGTFEVFYVGEGAGGAAARKIGHATSPDGITFTKAPGNPLFGMPLWAPATMFGEPHFWRDGDYLHVTFDSAVTTGYRRISRAMSADGGLTWAYHPFAIGPGPAGAWDSALVFDSAPVIHQGRLYVFHGGAAAPGNTQGMGADIGLSIADYRADAL